VLRPKVEKWIFSKIGSGECNDYHWTHCYLWKPVILSTGMNTIESVQKTVSILMIQHSVALYIRFIHTHSFGALWCYTIARSLSTRFFCFLIACEQQCVFVWAVARS
jgi:hypothetical protein